MRPGISFRDFAQRCWPLPDAFVANRYPEVAHGIGLCDEYPGIPAIQDWDDRGYQGGYEGVIEEARRFIRKKSKMGGILTGLNALLGADEVIFLSAAGKGGAYEFRGWHQSGTGLAPIKVTVARDAQFLTSLQQLVAVTLEVLDHQVRIV